MAQPVPVLARDIHVAYGAVAILGGVDLEAKPGEMLGLVGPNGAGKTTLLRVLSGALKPQRGEVWANGTNLARLSPRDRARLVAVVPQSPVAPPEFTALEVVLMGRNPHLGLLQWEGPLDMQIARRALELTDTVEFALRPVASLSGGERQRVFLARALAQEAPVLLLDEPTAHLDIGYQCSVLDTVASIRKEAGVTVVAAMHELTLAAQYCDRIAALYGGRIASVGCPDEVLNPEFVSAAYGADVTIIAHPVHGTPVVIPCGQRTRQAAGIRQRHSSNESGAGGG